MKQGREREGEWWMIVVGRGGKWMDGWRESWRYEGREKEWGSRLMRDGKRMLIGMNGQVEREGEWWMAAGEGEREGCRIVVERGRRLI